MKKYSKVSVALVVMLLVSSIGFSTAFGYGSRSSGSRAKPVITPAPVGQVLGESTMSVSAFVDMLIAKGIIAPEKASFLKLLVSLGLFN
jgi:hypothetical protein